jgi:hypothetical protein
MSVFDNAFGTAAKTMMSVFGEDEFAMYTPAGGIATPLRVGVERGVKDSDQSVMMVNSTIVISWLKSDRSEHARGDVITLANDESYRLNKLSDDDGMFISYQVIKA